MGDVRVHYKEEELEPYQKDLLEWKGKGFDNRVHIVDHKTGKLLKEQHYRLVVDNAVGSYYIRDGVRYSESGGRLDPVPNITKAKDDKKLSQ